MPSLNCTALHGEDCGLGLLDMAPERLSVARRTMPIRRCSQSYQIELRLSLGHGAGGVTWSFDRHGGAAGLRQPPLRGARLRGLS